MGRARFTLRTLLVATAINAVGFAVFGVMISGILSTALMIIALSPFSSRWQTYEFAATVAWLLGAILAFSNVSVSREALDFLMVSGFLLSCTWTLREFVRWANQSSKIVWTSLLAVPSSMLLAFALAITDLDLSLRLALSESALMAEMRRNTPVLRGHTHRVGLFLVSEVQDNQGGFCLKLDDMFASNCIVAYYPGAMPAKIGYRFRHIHGPWWGLNPES